MKSIRLRLAFVYTTVLALVLVLVGLALYVAVEEHMARTLDDSIAEVARHVASAINVDGQSDLHSVLLPDLDPFAVPGAHVQVLDGTANAIAHSAGLGIMALPVDATAIDRALAGTPSYYTASVGGERIRVENLPLRADGRVIGVIQVGKSYHDYDLTLTQLGQLMAIGGVFALLLTGLSAWAVAGRALRPVAEMTQTARAIALSQGFGRRLAQEKPGDDEVGQLALAFNEMLESLEGAYTAQRRFVADASHELRAPLTTIRGNLEFVRRSRALPPELRDEALADALSEAERMARLVGDLLALARADTGQALDMQPVQLGEVVRDVYGELMPRAGHVRLQLDGTGEATVWGDRDRLKQVVLILADNALKYTPAGGRVTVSVRQEQGIARLQVADSGIGIGAEDLPHLFERFYRADKARARDGGGTGLGLAIASAIVERHNGSIEVRSTPGTGSTFMVSLPLLPRSAAGSC
ncbi:MAG: sensor histidine kinase [Chloroflexota bacterium]